MRQASQDYAVAVNEQGQLITNTTNWENALVCYYDNDWWNIGGGASNFFTQSQWNDLLQNWGSEIITEMDDSSTDRHFVLPAKNGMVAQRYTVDMMDGTIDPNITDYSE